ncbi:HNH endonuclease, partial [Saccharopolyspora erythraea]
MVGAHRVAYVLASGEDIPPGMMLDQTCRVRRCVSPDHLRVTRGATYRGAASRPALPKRCATWPRRSSDSEDT